LTETIIKLTQRFAGQVYTKPLLEAVAKNN
jgi:hypothetical protein